MTRVRERGWHGLAQVLKSYRDMGVRYPVYEQGVTMSPVFDKLGPLRFHQREAATTVRARKSKDQND